MSKVIYLEHLKTLKKGKNSPEKVSCFKNVGALLEARQDVLKNFKSNIFPIKSDTTPRELSINDESFMNETSSQQKRKGLKILTPKQILKKLPIALAQLKAGNNSKSLLNEIRQIVYSLYQSKEITKIVYNNIIKSIKV